MGGNAFDRSLCFIFVSRFGLPGSPALVTMMRPMSAKRVVIYIPDALLDALNRATLASPHSRSDIICAALERFLRGMNDPKYRQVLDWIGKSLKPVDPEYGIDFPVPGSPIKTGLFFVRRDKT